MEIWIAAGDETGGWDIVDGSFSTDFTGLAWVLGPLSAWEHALQMPLGNSTALAAFSQPISARLPDGIHLPVKSLKYHVKDVWTYANRKRIVGDIVLSVPNEDPVLDLLRRDAEWLLQRSGLGVLAVGGSASDGKAAGLGHSGDGLRERARAFAGLMTVALPFLPGDAKLNLLAEGRTETDIADAAKYNRFSDYASDTRTFEPYRNFIGHLMEDMTRASDRCRPAIADGTVTNQFFCIGSKGLGALISKLRGVSFLQSHADQAVAAMKGIADLAATLMPRPEGGDCKLMVPQNFSANLWTGNYRELKHAIHK